MRLKQVRNLTLIIALLSMVALFSYRLGEDNAKKYAATADTDMDLSLMWQVKKKLAETFLEKDKMENKTMVYGAISGMVASLGDPYTVFLPPSENKSSNEDLAGEFGGVGIQLGYSQDKVLSVMSPLAKTPAEKAGVKAGDLILRITDKSKNIDKDTNGISLDEAVKTIRGPIGTEVTLKLYRESTKENLEKTLKRENIVVPSIELEWKESQGKKIAWVKLYKFTDRLFTEWNQIVEDIKKEKNRGGMVLDLRNNPGGYLQASVMVASDFINEGVVVKQQYSNGKEEVYKVDPTRKKLLDEKMTVLINGGSASASEILAGALKDYNRGKLVGEKSFGKGTVQQPEDFKDGSGLHVTIAKWLLPNGKNIHKEGVMPDVEVKDDAKTPDDEQLNKAIEVLLAK